MLNVPIYRQPNICYTSYNAPEKHINATVWQTAAYESVHYRGKREFNMFPHSTLGGDTSLTETACAAVNSLSATNMNG